MIYGFVLVPDCAIHIINVYIPSERSERGKNYVAPYKLPDSS